MGKKIQCIGRYTMDAVTLGKGNFAHVELATHGVTNIKVSSYLLITKENLFQGERGMAYFIFRAKARISILINNNNVIRVLLLSWQHRTLCNQSQTDMKIVKIQNTSPMKG